MSVTGIVLKTVNLFFAIGFFIALYQRVKSLKKYGVISIVYILIIGLLLTLPALLNLFHLQISEILLLAMVQIFILAVGILHIKMAGEILPWYKQQAFSNRLLLNLVILLFAYFLSNLFLSLVAVPRLPLVWYLSLLWFLIPLLLNHTVEEYLKIPPKIFKKWFFPIDQHIDDPHDEELENPIVISFVFPKSKTSSEITTFRAKAPIGMKLGRLFYFFINDYNGRHPESPISVAESRREPHGWIFQKVKSKFWGVHEALDPEQTIYFNNIKENDVLICTRVTDPE